MADGYRADIEDQGDIEAYLERLSVAFRREAIKRSIAAVCKVVRDAAKARCPVKTGTLRSRISYVVREYDQAIVGVVGERRVSGQRPYGHLVENGHLIATASGDKRRVGANPFLRRAVDETAMDQEVAFIGSLTKDLKDQ